MTAGGRDAPDIFSAEFNTSPESYYQLLLEEHPFYWHEAAQAFIVSRYSDVHSVLRNPIFTTRNYEWQLEPVHGRNLMQMDGREHATHRGMVGPALRGKDLAEKIVPVIERTSRDLLNNWKADGRVDLVGQYSTRFPISVIVEMLGLPHSDHDLFHRWYNALIQFAGNLAQDKDTAERGLQAKNELEEYIIPVIHDRRKSPGSDLLSTLCQAEIDGLRMSDVEIKSFVSLLLAGGGETTDTAITKLMRELIDHPEQMEAVRADRNLITHAIAEVVRYTPPVVMLMRVASEDVQLETGAVPKNANVIVVLGAANRDPRAFANPDEFMIHRGDLDIRRAFGGSANHVGFGQGRHFCVGSMLARAEVEIGFSHLLDAMKDIQFAEGTTRQENGIFFRGLSRLDLVFTPA